MKQRDNSLDTIKPKPLVLLHGEIKTPPFSTAARIEAGVCLRQLQMGMSLDMPISRTMPSIGSRCAELRIVDEKVTWRNMYRVDSDAILIAEVFAKKTLATPKSVIDICKKRFRQYDILLMRQLNMLTDLVDATSPSRTKRKGKAPF